MLRLWIKDSMLFRSSPVWRFRAAWAAWATGATAGTRTGTTGRSTFALLSRSRAAFFPRLLLPFLNNGFTWVRLLSLNLFLLFVGKGSDDLLSLVVVDCYYSKLKLERLFGNVLKDWADLYLFIIINKYAAHEFPRFLIDVDSNIFDGSVLVESFFDVLIGKVAIDVLDIKAGIFLQLE